MQGIKEISRASKKAVVFVLWLSSANITAQAKYVRMTFPSKFTAKLPDLMRAGLY